MVSPDWIVLFGVKSFVDVVVVLERIVLVVVVADVEVVDVLLMAVVVVEVVVVEVLVVEVDCPLCNSRQPQ